MEGTLPSGTLPYLRVPFLQVPFDIFFLVPVYRGKRDLKTTQPSLHQFRSSYTHGSATFIAAFAIFCLSIPSHFTLSQSSIQLLTKSIGIDSIQKRFFGNSDQQQWHKKFKLLNRLHSDFFLLLFLLIAHLNFGKSIQELYL